MKVVAYEGFVEDGKVTLPPDLHLPEKTRVVVVVTGLDPMPAAKILSPRLVHPEQMAELKKEVVGEASDAVI